jgi:lipopolysaccharide heptosyltransferase I
MNDAWQYKPGDDEKTARFSAQFRPQRRRVVSCAARAMKILIVKLGSIGDIVHTLPALAALRRALPEAEISWVAEKRAAEILRGNPLLEHLIETDTKKLRRAPVSGETLLATRWQLNRLRAARFDVAFDFQGLLKSAFIARLSGARRRYGFTREALREPASRFFLTDTVPTPPRANVIVKNLSLVAGALGVEVPRDPAEFEFPLAIEKTHEDEAAKLAEQAGGAFAVLNPGGGWPTKLWPAKRFGALADALWQKHGLASLITYGPGETELAARVAGASSSGHAHAVSPSLKGFYALARLARLYVGGDTGPTHLAVAAGASVAGIFGPTEWWRNGSPRPADICIERADIPCRVNCHRRACNNWICLDIEVEQVLRFVETRMARP